MSGKGKPRAADPGELNVDRYIKESCHSFKECNIKNNARRNSLQKRTLGIESERKMARAMLSRDEKLLRDQLKQMHIEKMKYSLVNSMREKKSKKEQTKPAEREKMVIPIEPYPVTFRTRIPSPVDIDRHLEDAGRAYAGRRYRRQSREFEDLSLETGSHALLNIDEDVELGTLPRRRVYSMSGLPTPRPRTRASGSNTSTPRASPGLRRKVSGRGRKGSCSSGSPSGSLNGSIGSLDDIHWVGDPEAIHSVRRARKTVEEQELETEIHKLKSPRK